MVEAELVQTVVVVALVVVLVQAQAETVETVLAL
jgi:hypothetical protein